MVEHIGGKYISKYELPEPVPIKRRKAPEEETVLRNDLGEKNHAMVVFQDAFIVVLKGVGILEVDAVHIVEAWVSEVVGHGGHVATQDLDVAHFQTLLQAALFQNKVHSLGHVQSMQFVMVVHTVVVVRLNLVSEFENCLVAQVKFRVELIQLKRILYKIY